MAGGGSSKSRKRVEATPADAVAATGPSLVRAKDGSAFARCDECGKSVPAALINMHSCSLDAKIRMNLESQTVEKQSEAKKPAERKRPATSEPKAKKSKTEKRGKKDKDPNAPKRPATAFFVFMDDFRKSYKEEHPDSKGVKEVAKEGGEKWKSLTDEEKKPYQDKAAELKAEYEKALEALKTENENENEDDEKETEEEEVAEKEVEEITDEE